MKRKNVIDSSAILKFLQQEKGYEVVKGHLIKAAHAKDPILLNIVNYGEISYIIKRHYSQEQLDNVQALLGELPIKIYGISLELIHIAVNLKTAYNFPYIDAICAATAILENGNVLTSDKDFTKIEKEVPVIWV